MSKTFSQDGLLIRQTDTVHRASAEVLGFGNAVEKTMTSSSASEAEKQRVS